MTTETLALWIGLFITFLIGVGNFWLGTRTAPSQANKLDQETIELQNKNIDALSSRLVNMESKYQAAQKLIDALTEQLNNIQAEVTEIYAENELLRAWGQANSKLVERLGGKPIPLSPRVEKK